MRMRMTKQMQMQMRGDDGEWLTPRALGSEWEILKFFVFFFIQ